ncbi:flagellar export protein FliJ [Paraconexibacter algicola]|uniref:Flagellar FliJ protein n=2 Tax=Paraconexibacter algicola TaxID=2133960 RepID=A0A2T4UIV8_9ACTN|nr:flagellar export protein FliJ [Paraconexibacter algicola]
MRTLTIRPGGAPRSRPPGARSADRSSSPSPEVGRRPRPASRGLHARGGPPTTPVMKERFDFGLERVRRVRVHDEDRAKEALAASLAHRERHEARLQAVAAQLESARFAAPLAAEAAVDVAALRARQAYVERLERTRLVAALEVDRADAEVDARRTVVTAASRKREVLDRLRDRQAAAHRLEIARAEGVRLDEIALQGHLRAKAA